MSEVFDHLMSDVKRLTACRTKCPFCGHIGMATWSRVEDVCGCRSCGKKFAFKANTYRPLTEGMTDKERRKFYKRNIKSVSEVPESEQERLREMGRIRNRRYRAKKRIMDKNKMFSLQKRGA